jgi:hypothetical protein
VTAVWILCCSNKEVEMSVSLATVQNTRCGYVYNIFLKYHMPNLRGSLFIAIKPNAKENICMAAMSLFYIL